MKSQRKYRTVAGVWQGGLYLMAQQMRFWAEPASGKTENGGQSRSADRDGAPDSEGATSIEYGLIAAIVALGIIAGLDQVEAAIEFLYSFVNTETQGVTDSLAAE